MDAVFHCAVTAYLVSIEKFLKYVAPAVSPHGGYDFPYFITTLFQKAVDAVFLCCHYAFNKQWTFSHLLSLLFHLAVEVIFHIFSPLSLKKQCIQFSFHSFFFPYLVSNVSLTLIVTAVDMIFHMFGLFSFKKQQIQLRCHCVFIKQWIDFRILSPLSFKKQ